jgi:hypothetical protein
MFVSGKHALVSLALDLQWTALFSKICAGGASARAPGPASNKCSVLRNHDTEPTLGRLSNSSESRSHIRVLGPGGGATTCDVMSAVNAGTCVPARRFCFNLFFW